MLYNQAMSKFIILTGKPYAGKTTLGKAIVQQFGYEAVDVDVTKERLYGLGLKDDDLTNEQWITIYDETDKQIATYLKEGKNVIDDSRNFRKFERVHANAIADQCDAGFVTIYVNTPEAILRARLLENRRRPTRHDLEDTDFEELLALFEPPAEDEHPLFFNGEGGIEEWIAEHATAFCAMLEETRNGGALMTDTEILQHIEQLVNEEHELFQRSEATGLDETEHARMKALEVSLDQCWDLLRQRRARRSAGLNPDEAAERDPNIVERYQQ